MKTFMRLAIVSFTVYMLITIIGLQADIRKSEEQLAELEAQVTEQQLGNDEIERLIAGGNDEESAERIAREKLGYVMPDEKVYIDMSGK